MLGIFFYTFTIQFYFTSPPIIILRCNFPTQGQRNMTITTNNNESSKEPSKMPSRICSHQNIKRKKKNRPPLNGRSKNTSLPFRKAQGNTEQLHISQQPESSWTMLPKQPSICLPVNVATIPKLQESRRKKNTRQHLVTFCWASSAFTELRPRLKTIRSFFFPKIRTIRQPSKKVVVNFQKRVKKFRLPFKGRYLWCGLDPRA